MNTEIISRKEAKEKGIGRYFTGKPCKYGHITQRYVSDGRCLECSSNRDQTDWYHKNKDRRRKYKQQEWYKEYSKKYRQEWYRENREHALLYAKNWARDNVEKKNAYQRSDSYKEYRKKRYKEELEYKLNVYCRNIVKRTLNASGKNKNNPTYETLGYDTNTLKLNMENKFLPGMSWENRQDWHIDHKYPVSKYISEGVTDPSIINALDNLIPMWAEDNLSKSDRTLEEYLAENPEKMDLYGKFLDNNESEEYTEDTQTEEGETK